MVYLYLSRLSPSFVHNKGRLFLGTIWSDQLIYHLQGQGVHHQAFDIIRKKINVILTRQENLARHCPRKQ